MSRDIAEWLALGTAHPVDPANVGRGAVRVRRLQMRRVKTILDTWLSREFKCSYTETLAGAAIDGVSIVPTEREKERMNISAKAPFSKLVGATEIIYVIQPESVQRVKIGSTTYLPTRISGLQTACPFRIRLIAQMPCIKNMEHIIHAAFAAERLHGEWFDVSARLAEFIECVKRGDKKEMCSAIMRSLGIKET